VDTIDLSVVIPVYRSAETLHALVERLLRVLKDSGKRYEIIFVEDGSPDNAWEFLCALQRSYPECVAAIQLLRNYSQHNALMCGFRHTRDKYIVTMDDDLQHPLEEILKLLEAIETSGLDLVYGSCDSKKHRTGRNIGSRLANAF
jgi:polyisoprenyl-phosphate glycosyltransferase